MQRSPKTVRDVPAKVDRDLRRKAADEQESLNELLVEALTKEAGLCAYGNTVQDDLKDLTGKWVEDPEFDAAIAEQERIEPCGSHRSSRACEGSAAPLRRAG